RDGAARVSRRLVRHAGTDGRVDACCVPRGLITYNRRMAHRNPTTEEIRALLTEARTIAMVGASSNPEKDSYGIMHKLQRAGYRIIPVNPRDKQVLGQPAYASL